MNNRSRKKKNQNQNFNSFMMPSAPLTEAKKNKILEEAKELLFKPLIYKDPTSTIDFDHVHIPFMINDYRIYVMMFMDCYDISVYTECWEINDKHNPIEAYKNGIKTMKECLDIEKLTGTEYYFGHLDKAYDRYLYAMQLFVDNGIIEKDCALDIIKDLGADGSDMIIAYRKVSEDILESQSRNARIRANTKMQNDADNMMLKLVTDALSETINEQESAGDNNETED